MSFRLIEVDGCIFDRDQLVRSHGFYSLDSVGREAFVNHLHLEGGNAPIDAERIIEAWRNEMQSRWPDRVFRIYRQIEPTEITIRFHVERQGVPNWCEQGIEIIPVPARVA